MAVPLAPSLRGSARDFNCGCCGGTVVVVGSADRGSHVEDVLRRYFELQVGDPRVAQEGTHRVIQEAASPEYPHLSADEQLALRGESFKQKLLARAKELAPTLLEKAAVALRQQLAESRLPLGSPDSIARRGSFAESGRVTHRDGRSGDFLGMFRELAPDAPAEKLPGLVRALTNALRDQEGPVSVERMRTLARGLLVAAGLLPKRPLLQRTFSVERIRVEVELGTGTGSDTARAVTDALPEVMNGFGFDSRRDQGAMLWLAALLAEGSGSMTAESSKIVVGGGGVAAR